MAWKRWNSYCHLKKCLNVRQKLGTRSHSLTLTVSHSLTLVILNNFCFHVYAKSHILTLSLSHSHTISLSHSLSLDMLNNFCFHVYARKSLSHFHTLSLSHSHTLSFSHSLSLDMLNKFCFHLNAENSLFIAENCNGIFRDILTLSCYIRCHRAGSQLKMPNFVVFICRLIPLLTEKVGNFLVHSVE